LKRKAYKDERDRVEEVFSRWIEVLGLGHWRVTRHYYDSAPEYREAAGQDASYMTCSPDYPYLKASICIDCEATAEIDDCYLEECAVHELMHLHLDELAQLFPSITPDIRNHFEHAAQTLARAMIWVRDDAERRVAKAFVKEPAQKE
jgi:hypothetical protein